MPRTLHIESSISALQNRGGYLRVSVLDNPLDRIFRALSWLLAAASAFVRAVGGSALGVVAEYPLPLHFTLYTLHQNIHPTLEQDLAQSDKGSPPLHFTPYTLH